MESEAGSHMVHAWKQSVGRRNAWLRDILGDSLVFMRYKQLEKSKAIWYVKERVIS